MKLLFSTTVVFLVSIFVTVPGLAQKKTGNGEVVPPKGYVPPIWQASPPLQAILTSAIDQTLESYPAGSFPKTDIAATLIDLSGPGAPTWAGVRAD